MHLLTRFPCRQCRRRRQKRGRRRRQQRRSDNLLLILIFPSVHMYCILSPSPAAAGCFTLSKPSLPPTVVFLPNTFCLALNISFLFIRGGITLWLQVRSTRASSILVHIFLPPVRAFARGQRDNICTLRLLGISVFGLQESGTGFRPDRRVVWHGP